MRRGGDVDSMDVDEVASVDDETFIGNCEYMIGAAIVSIVNMAYSL